MTISALVLTKNEEEMIEGCLKQLNFANEIIVLDQNSTDNTLEIAKKYTGRIFKSSANDFAQNRNTLKDQANGKWLLYVDADDRLSQELIKEINVNPLDAAAAPGAPIMKFVNVSTGGMSLPSPYSLNVTVPAPAVPNAAYP